uniref:Uncharacterized protein n=1 Tax=Clandestinovirus TaxID=2831644 RepID=A0A8F8KL10_9VIRU|nr:hypothetical protein KOM_12_360 [Clandestinovirus]
MATRYDFGAKPPSIVRFTDSGANLNLTTCVDRGILFRAGTSIQGTSNATINSDGSITLGSATINGSDITITNLYVDNLASKTPGNPITVNGVPLDVGGSVDFFTITPDSGASSFTIRSFASVTTTNATPTTLLNMDTAFPSQGTYVLYLDVIGIDQASEDSCVFKVIAKFDRTSSNVKRITIPTLTNINDASLSTASIDITTTSLSVTGKAATTIKWTASGQISVQKH